MKLFFHMLFKIAAITGMSILSAASFAHGENLPGPNGGFIRMPGAFHIEVIPQQNGFKILLLDIGFQHPLIQHSTVKAVIKQDTKSMELRCKPKQNYFYCSVDPKQLAKATSLEVTAVRNNAKGAPAIYPLPLKRS
ncbi:hypothetical protein AQUSIP_16950 [Aquicella siphonis]|uniref:EfeO-type cupredoxin-like domain-containing protein n=1 Tax=Aquicella siphonis TaxID=254247 RepID=A0A5E4PIY9_9COXI|nr:hypothetical protein [Aquicella siphonis]VVC76383.1 hypothetical protein AQUSIP_16950 [Aquicella siphonis]